MLAGGPAGWARSVRLRFLESSPVSYLVNVCAVRSLTLPLIPFIPRFHRSYKPLCLCAIIITLFTIMTYYFPFFFQKMLGEGRFVFVNGKTLSSTNSGHCYESSDSHLYQNTPVAETDVRQLYLLIFVYFVFNDNVHCHRISSLVQLILGRQLTLPSLKKVKKKIHFHKLSSERNFRRLLCSFYLFIFCFCF